MRKMAFAISLAVSLPTTVGAAVDASAPDGPYAGRTAVADGEQGGHTGSSNDPNGNMGNVGRTGKKDAGVDALSNSGAEGASGSDQPDRDHEPAPPLTGQSPPPP
jgi:hypothetical protein